MFALVEGWSRSTGAVPGGGEYGLQATLDHTDGAHGRGHLPFTKGVHEWEKTAKRLVAEQAFERLVIRIVYDDQAGRRPASTTCTRGAEDAPDAPALQATNTPRPEWNASEWVFTAPVMFEPELLPPLA